MQSISEKYGTANALAMFNHLKQAGREEGIHFNFPERTPNTFDAHRLMTKAEKVGGLEMQNKLASILFRYYFEEARFIDRAALKQAAEEAQLNIVRARAIFNLLRLDQKSQTHSRTHAHSSNVCTHAYMICYQRTLMPSWTLTKRSNMCRSPTSTPRPVCASTVSHTSFSITSSLCPEDNLPRCSSRPSASSDKQQ
eukprot:GEZU01020483.1.p1 GENE.GEZU01020483.1~~GEZU01020483.1.p1  ORF type:complete len:196 (-),score=26.79 GEZU01020483.1:14-601(-)